ncbi:unnamed protein product [Protopolystoma xenopodis]|uniref:Helicase ATP-binding domain-containing protein n=1 Tax=Protopolystoma xenopodis TaxID=117903 RepID=A0A448WC62_9PLAT|nr:unnamed protein product [Protopolystoma xenopodis]
MSYEMFLQHADTVSSIDQIDLVVCDEGHRLKNAEIKTTAALKNLPAKRRLLLTGTPIQNSLEELWSLADLVAPCRLGSSFDHYRRNIVEPLTRTPQTKASCFLQDFICGNSLERARIDTTQESSGKQLDEEVLEVQRLLSEALSTFMLRRTSEIIASSLPDKCELILQLSSYL